jgi:hypothetical protein
MGSIFAPVRSDKGTSGRSENAEAARTTRIPPHPSPLPPCSRGERGTGVGGFCLQKALSARRTRVADGYPYQKPRRRSHFSNTLGAGRDNPRKMCYNRDSRALERARGRDSTEGGRTMKHWAQNGLKALTSAWVLALLATVAWSQSITWLGTTGGSSYAWGVSNDGLTVVGRWRTATPSSGIAPPIR